MDLKFEVEGTFLNEDHSWLASRLGFDTARPATLDLSLFTEGTHFPNGFIPSGMSLAKVTSGPSINLYGPYAANAAEVQTITRTATGGTVAISFDGETALAVPVVAATTAADVRAALETLSNIDPGDVVVTGAVGGPFVITFGGKYLGENVPLIDVDDTNATGGTVLLAQTTQGGSAVVDGRAVGSGLLLASSEVRPTNKTGRIVVPVMWQGIVRAHKLPANNGVDAAFMEQVNTIRWEA